jgi:hypothetical protein
VRAPKKREVSGNYCSLAGNTVACFHTSPPSKDHHSITTSNVTSNNMTEVNAELPVGFVNDPSDDEEVAQYNFAKFTKHAYVEYWHCFAQQNNLYMKVTLTVNRCGTKGVARW